MHTRDIGVSIGISKGTSTSINIDLSIDTSIHQKFLYTHSLLFIHTREHLNMLPTAAPAQNANPGREKQKRIRFCGPASTHLDGKLDGLR